jgi:hypothetical protein
MRRRISPWQLEPSTYAAKRFIVDYWSQDWSDLSVSSIVLRLELMSHYAHACLPKQFDSFVYRMQSGMKCAFQVLL